MSGRLKKRIAIIAAAAVCAMGLILLLNTLCAGKSIRVGANVDGASKRAVELIQSFGWECRQNPDEICLVTLPETFTGAMAEYLELQKEQGFDLKKHSKKTVKRYSFKVENYPESRDDVYANVLVFEDEIIGADLCARSIDGFITSLDCRNEKSAAKSGIITGSDPFKE